MLYFAYGSNLDWNQMRDRCPSARFLSIACAEGYRLEFTWFSRNRRCGVADIVASPGNEVWGAVFEIRDDEIGELDRREGYQAEREREKNSYERRQLDVICQSDSKSPIAVLTYFVVERSKSPLKPSVEYKSQILDGARHWRLPEAYIEKLEHIETQ
jgi:gamma-glutamylcyclotransferase